MSPATRTYLRRPQARRPAAPEGAALARIITRASAASTPREAERTPGVRRVIRGADVPRNLNTLLSLLELRQGRRAVAGDRQGPLQGRADRRRSSRTPSARRSRRWRRCASTTSRCTPVFDVEEALKPGAPVVNETYPKNTFEYHGKYDHQKLRFGDVEQAFAQADHVLEQRYQMSPIEHAPTETNGSIAAPETNGRFVVYTCAQGLFFSLDTTAKILDVPSNKLHFIGGTVGGGFGGKVDSLTEPLAMLGAMLTGRPVRYVLGREEEMQFGSPRGAERIYVKDAVMKDGRIIAAQGAQLFRQRRLHAAVELRGHQMRGAHSGAVHDPERPRRHLLRLHQPRARDRDARLRRHGGRFRDRMPDGQARASHRHGPDGVPHPQRLSRRRHEGAPARGEEHRADRMRAGRGREGEVADPRRVQAHVVARGRRRRARRDPAHADSTAACRRPRAPRRSAPATTGRCRRRPSRRRSRRGPPRSSRRVRPRRRRLLRRPRRRPPTCSTARRASPPSSARRRR